MGPSPGEGWAGRWTVGRSLGTKRKTEMGKKARWMWTKWRRLECESRGERMETLVGREAWQVGVEGRQGRPPRVY